MYVCSLFTRFQVVVVCEEHLFLIHWELPVDTGTVADADGESNAPKRDTEMVV